jgi:hypothetical protein
MEEVAMSGDATKVAARYLAAGGSDFSDYVAGKDARAAFRQAQEDARHESGHGGYSGTIAEKNGFTMRSSTPMTQSQAQDFISKDLGRNDKWGPAFAVPIAEEKVVGEAEYTVTVKAKNQDEATSLGKAAIAEKGRAKAGTTVVVDIPWANVKKVAEGGAPKMSFDRSTAETYFQWGASGSSWSRNTDKKKVLEAVAKELSDPHHQVGQKFPVMKVEVLGHVVKEAEAAKLPTWEVTGTRKQVVLGPVKGFIFYGIASS